MAAEAKEKADETAVLDGTGLDGESRESLADFFAQFSGGGHQFLIERLEPKQVLVAGKQRRMSGHLETTHTLPTPDYLRENYGGGLYKIRVFSHGAKGSRFAGSRRIEIAGDAKLRADAIASEEPPVGPVENPAIVEKLYQDKWRSEDRADRELRELRQQAARAAQRPAVDPVIEAIRESSMTQVETLRLELQRREREAAELRQQIHAVRSERSGLGDPEVLKAIFGRGADDVERQREAHRHELLAERERAARGLEAERERAVREQEATRRELEAERERATRGMESFRREVDTERERAARELEAERERATRGMESIRREVDTERERAARELEAMRHELDAERERATRELEAMRRDTVNQVALVERLHRSDVENLRAAHQGLLATKDAEIARLADEVRAARATASRPESLTEQVAKVDQFLELSQRIAAKTSGAAPAEDEGEEEEKTRPWYERIFDKDGFAERVAEKVIIHGAPPPPPAPTPRAARPQLHLVRAPVAPRQVMPAVTPPTVPHSAVDAASPSTEPPTASDAEKTAAMPAPNATEVAPTGKLLQGLQFLETALRGGQPAATVARAAHRLFDRDELSALVAAGGEQLAVAVEQIAPESVLLSHQGRHYLGEFLDALRAELPPAP